MATEETIRKVGEAINNHDLDAFIQQWAEDVVVYSPDSPEPLRGREAVGKNMEDFFTAFPDLKVEVKRILVHGDSTAAEMTFSGTNTGPMAGPQGTIPATNRRIELSGSGFHRYNSQGQILEERRYFDVMGMMMQLGLVPGP